VNGIGSRGGGICVLLLLFSLELGLKLCIFCVMLKTFIHHNDCRRNSIVSMVQKRKQENPTKSYLVCTVVSAIQKVERNYCVITIGYIIIIFSIIIAARTRAVCEINDH